MAEQSSQSAKSMKGRRRGITLYPASGARDNGTTGFRGDLKISAATNQVLSELHEEGHSVGLKSMMLFHQSPEEGGFSAVLVWAKPNYPLARHSHMSDCMYFVISGSATMGNVTLRPGDSVFVPAGAMYAYTAGPDGVEVLEVRHDVETIGTEMAEVSPETAARFRSAVVSNRERWAEMDVSPLFAANQAPIVSHEPTQ